MTTQEINPKIGQYVWDIYYNRKTQITGISNGLYFIGSEHEPIYRKEFIFPLPKKLTIEL